MSFLPAVPVGGYAGWAVLKRTATAQQAAYDKQPRIQRDEAYFRANISKVKSADDLVKDRRLLGIALGAFGLEADIDNKFFIRKVLEDGTLKPEALAMRLADKRYREFSVAIGLGDFGTSRIRMSDFADTIIRQWKQRQFEGAVGQVDDSLRLAMNAEREIAKIANSSMSEDARWFTLMGQRPLRQVLETAFGLPKSFGTLDLDQQKQVLKQRAKTAFGHEGVAQFARSDRMQALIKQYLLRNQVANNLGANPGGAALTLVTEVAASMRRS